MTRSPTEPYPDEIWENVLFFLRKSVPAPLSNPPRSALKQQHLATAARVCRLWQSISEKLLYRSIVTDDLPLLLADVGQSYRQRQLGLTRHLYVEYCVKGRGPTYEDLIGKGGELWPAVGLWGVELEAAQREECRPEVAAMEQVLTKLVKVGANTVFKRLLSLAVSSIYGDVYNKIFRGQPETEYNRVLSFGGAINLNSARAFRLFIQASNLRHLCIRDQRGPLSFPLTSYASLHPKKKVPLTPTLHFNQNVDFLPCTFGMPMRWVSEISLDWNCLLTNRMVSNCLQAVIKERRADFQRRKKPDLAKLTIYCTTAELSDVPDDIKASGIDPYYKRRERRPLGPWEQSEVAKTVGELGQQSFRKGSGGLLDIVKWLPAADTPECQACGVGAPVWEPYPEWTYKAEQVAAGNHAGCECCVAEGKGSHSGHFPNPLAPREH